MDFSFIDHMDINFLTENSYEKKSLWDDFGFGDSFKEEKNNLDLESNENLRKKNVKKRSEEIKTDFSSVSNLNEIFEREFDKEKKEDNFCVQKSKNLKYFEKKKKIQKTKKFDKNLILARFSNLRKNLRKC